MTITNFLLKITWSFPAEATMAELGGCRGGDPAAGLRRAAWGTWHDVEVAPLPGRKSVDAASSDKQVERLSRTRVRLPPVTQC